MDSRAVVLDFGTGDGRYVVRRAADDVRRVVVGVDADLAGLGRGFTQARRRRLTNAFFAVASAESPPTELREIAEELRIHFPWGSLLEAVLRPEVAVVRGLVTLVKAGGTIVLCLSVTDRDRLGTSVANCGDGHRVADALARVADVEVVAVEEMTTETVAELGSSWAKRLGVGRFRPAVQIELRRVGPSA